MRSLKKIDRDRRLTVRRRSTDPDVSSPTVGIVKNSFVTTIRYKQTARAIRAYREAVQEADKTNLALANLAEAKLERERAIRLLENAETIHEADAAEREETRLDALESLNDTRVNAELAAMKREQCLTLARVEYDRFLKEHENRTSEQSRERFDIPCVSFYRRRSSAQ